MRIGFFGGAFDPITITHIRLCEFLVTHDWLDEVWIMPCYKSYYNKKMTSDQDRLAMCRLAVATLGNPKVKVCDYEITHQSTGCSEEIWDELTREYNYPRTHEMYFVIGMDNALNIHTWTNPERVMNKIKFLVIPRDGWEPHPEHWYHEDPHKLVDSFVSDSVSSTLVRTAIKEFGKSDLVLPEVLEYIKEHQLYEYTLLS